MDSKELKANSISSCTCLVYIPRICPHKLYFLPEAIGVEVRDYFYSLGEIKLVSLRDSLPFCP